MAYKGPQVITGPASSTDNTIPRFDGTVGDLIQGSSVVISDANAVSGVTQLDVDNIRINGNTISSTDASGNIILATESGLGRVICPVASGGYFQATIAGPPSLPSGATVLCLIGGNVNDNPSYVIFQNRGTPGTSCQGSIYWQGNNGGSALNGMVRLRGIGNDFNHNNSLFQLYVQSSSSLTNTLNVTGGSFAIQNTLSKAAGSFHIDHPLDPNNKDLLHGFVEAPRYELIYRGTVSLVNGAASVNIDEASGMTPGTFAALTKNSEVLSLTNKSSFSRLRAMPLVNGAFTIVCEDGASNDEVTWCVIAERNDSYVRIQDPQCDGTGSLVVEIDKEEWIHPLDMTEQNQSPKNMRQVNIAEAVNGQQIDFDRVGKKGCPRHFRAFNHIPPLESERNNARSSQ